MLMKYRSYVALIAFIAAYMVVNIVNYARLYRSKNLSISEGSSERRDEITANVRILASFVNLSMYLPLQTKTTYQSNYDIYNSFVLVAPFEREDIGRIFHWLTTLSLLTTCQHFETGSYLDLVLIYVEVDQIGNYREVDMIRELLMRHLNTLPLFTHPNATTVSCHIVPFFMSISAPGTESLSLTNLLMEVLSERGYAAMLLLRADTLPTSPNWMQLVSSDDTNSNTDAGSILHGMCEAWRVRKGIAFCKACEHQYLNALYALRCPRYTATNTNIIQNNFLSDVSAPILPFLACSCSARKLIPAPALVSSRTMFLSEESQHVLQTAENSLDLTAGQGLTDDEARQLLQFFLPLFYSNEADPAMVHYLLAPPLPRQNIAKLVRRRYRALLRAAEYWHPPAANSPSLTNASTNSPPRLSPNVTYMFTADFHAGPLSCQLPLLKDLGVVVHGEVDYKNCKFSGYCANRLQVLRYDRWRGFSLQTDGQSPAQLIERFQRFLRSDPEMRRVDIVTCSHPAANCQLFLPPDTDKSMDAAYAYPSLLVYLTTRLEFGRHDGGLGWRRGAGWTLADGQERWKDWIRDLVRLYNQSIDDNQRGQHYIVANNMYDQHYAQYFTGMEIPFMPSWCGDTNYAYEDIVLSSPPLPQSTLRKRSLLSYTYDSIFFSPKSPHRSRTYLSFVYPPPSYQPHRDAFLIVPHRTNINAPTRTSKRSVLAKSTLVQELKKSLTPQHRIHFAWEKYANGYRLRDLTHYRALIYIPYQVSTISFLQYYRLSIPIFAPSLSLLLDWQRRFGLMWERVYGWPECLPSSVLPSYLYAMACPPDIPYPNNESLGVDGGALAVWGAMADWLVLPHVVRFSSLKELSHLLLSTDLWKVSEDMKAYNRKERSIMVRVWGKLLNKLKRRRT